MSRTKRGTNACRILFGNLLENGKYNIKVGSIELGCEASRMEMAQGRLEMQTLELAMLDFVCFMLRLCQFF
jgi:hypothetical protein